MLIISEWLPNPTGNDTAGEWIELRNAGQEPIQIGGYSIVASKGKAYVFGTQTLLPDQYVMLPREASKLTLRNTNESLTLSNAAGEVVDVSKFAGSAPEGKSFSRVGSQFIFNDPTPGTANSRPMVAAVESAYPFHTPLHAPVSLLEWVFVASMVGIGLSLAVTTIIGRNADLSKLFFE